MKHLE